MRVFKMLSGFVCLLMLVSINVVAQDEMVASYPFDVDGTDETGNYNATLMADATIVDDDLRGNVLSLIDSGYVSLPVELSGELTDFSIASWINFGGTNPWAGLWSIGTLSGGAAPYWDFHIQSNGTLSFYASQTDIWPSDGCAMTVSDYTCPTYKWVHIGFTFIKDSGAVVYINGIAQTLASWAGNNEFDVAPSDIVAEVFNIGKDSFNKQTLTNTKIDNFKVFDYALTSEEVEEIYEKEVVYGLDDGLVLHLPFEGNLEDVVGGHDGHPALKYGGYEPEYYDDWGISGQYAYFDGIASYVNIPPFDGIRWPHGASFSIQFWMRDDEPSHAVIVGRDQAAASPDTADNAHWWVGTWVGGNAVFGLGDNFFDLGPYVGQEEPETVVDDEWHMITAVRDGSAEMEFIYVDDVLVNSAPYTYEGHFIATDSLNIGYLEWGDTPGVWNYSGEVDEVLIYNRALRGDEVAKRYKMVTTIEDTKNRIVAPLNFNLLQNYPNPFNSITNIEFTIPVKSNIKLSVYNILGQQVAVLLQGIQNAGRYSISFNGSNLPSSTYFYRLATKSQEFTKKMLLLK